MMEASMLKGTTLKKQLPDTAYAKVSTWFNWEAEIDLAKLDHLNPISVMIFAYKFEII
jgi:hypothetical protein